jgi:hypothetical protein
VALIARHPDDETWWTQLRAALAAMGRVNAMLAGYARGVTPPAAPRAMAVPCSSSRAQAAERSST